MKQSPKISETASMKRAAKISIIITVGIPAFRYPLNTWKGLKDQNPPVKAKCKRVQKDFVGFDVYLCIVFCT